MNSPARLIVTNREMRCGICGSPQADVVNGWLARRGEKLPGGETITLPYILDHIIPPVLGRTLSETAVRRHLRRHVQILDGEEAAEAEADEVAGRDAALDLFERILGADWQEHPPTVDALLELQRALYARTLAEDVKAGRQVKISHDQFIRGSAEATRRRQNEAANFLLRGMAQGLSAVFTKALADRPSSAGELGPGIEIVDVDDVLGGNERG